MPGNRFEAIFVISFAIRVDWDPAALVLLVDDRRGDDPLLRAIISPARSARSLLRNRPV